MGKKVVTVICRLPTTGIIFRGPVVNHAFDDAHHPQPPGDLELRAGVNEGIDLATVEYHAKRVAGVKFTRANDTFTLRVADDDERASIAAGRRALDAQRKTLRRPRVANDSRSVIDRAIASNRIISV